MERLTLQRQAVLHAFARDERPLSPAELLAAAMEMVPTLNLSTIYRQIKALLTEGAIREVQLPGQPPRYEMRGENEGEDHRHYFQCFRCTRVFPLEGCPGHIEKLAPPGFVVTNHYLVLEGTCAQCSA